MQLLYEEDGDLKVGAVLGESPASFQVESQHGRRSKIKPVNVLLAIAAVAATRARRRGEQIDPLVVADRLNIHPGRP